MKTKEQIIETSNKIAEYWYKELHMQHAPIFQKQKLRDFAQAEIENIVDSISHETTKQ